MPAAVKDDVDGVARMLCSNVELGTVLAGTGSGAAGALEGAGWSERKADGLTLTRFALDSKTVP
jgi:hypothetical protein